MTAICCGLKYEDQDYKLKNNDCFKSKLAYGENLEMTVVFSNNTEMPLFTSRIMKDFVVVAEIANNNTENS